MFPELLFPELLFPELLVPVSFVSLLIFVQVFLKSVMWQATLKVSKRCQLLNVHKKTGLKSFLGQINYTVYEKSKKTFATSENFPVYVFRGKCAPLWHHSSSSSEFKFRKM
jgi:hypothetical protein